MSRTSQRASAQASSTDLNKTRIAFMERASAPNIPPHAFKLGWLIAYRYMNRKTWTAYPPQERLARDLNVSVRTVQRLLDILEPLGLGIAPGDGRGKASTYWLDPVTAKGTERATPVSSFPAQKGDKKGRQKPPKRVTPVSPQPIENQEESFVGELKLSPQRRERDVRASRESFPSIEGSAPDAAPDLFLEPGESSRIKTETEPVAPKRTPEGERAEGVEVDPPAVIARRESDEHWRELRAIWQRGWAGDDTPKAQAIARQAFERACREADPDDILDGARVWVAAFEAGDGVRYLPALPQWLIARQWERPPPPTKPKRHSGTAPRWPNGRHRDKDDPMRDALLMGGYVEDEDGNLYNPNGNAGSSFDWRPAS